MTETLANGYSSDSSQRGLSYEYQDDLVRMIFIIFCILVHLTKEATALEGLTQVAGFQRTYHLIVLVNWQYLNPVTHAKSSI